jgi:hypothetical protein
MGLGTYLDHMLGDDGGADLSSAGRLSDRLFQLTHDRQVTTALIATTFWQAFLHSGVLRLGPRFVTAAYSVVAGKAMRPKLPEVYVVCHAIASGRPRYDLLVIDPTAKSETLVDATVSENQLRRGWRRFSSRGVARFMRNGGPVGELAREGMMFAIEASRAEKFRAVVTPSLGGTANAPPALLATASVPNPSLPAENALRSTAGVFATDSDGRSGVTVAAHTLDRQATQAKIGRMVGQVLGRDDITDSCFVQIDEPPYVPTAGPLRDVLPRPLEDVFFYRVGTGRIDTHVDGWTYELPYPIPGCQSRITTPAVTNPGDSGAALLDQRGHVLGFSFVRSGFGQKNQFSAWIWAATVFDFHGLT